MHLVDVTTSLESVAALKQPALQRHSVATRLTELVMSNFS